MVYFDFISKNQRYLTAVKNVNDHIIFDMDFPKHWVIKDEYNNSEVYTIKLNNLPPSKNTDLQSVSFICKCKKENIDCVENVVDSIIEYNIIKDKKEELFTTKTNELKKIFNDNSLEELEDLEFIINGSKPIVNNPNTRYLYKIAYYLVVFNRNKLQKEINIYEKKYGKLTASDWGRIYQITKERFKKFG